MANPSEGAGGWKGREAKRGTQVIVEFAFHLGLRNKSRKLDPDRHFLARGKRFDSTVFPVEARGMGLDSNFHAPQAAILTFLLVVENIDFSVLPWTSRRV